MYPCSPTPAAPTVALPLTPGAAARLAAAGASAALDVDDGGPARCRQLRRVG